MILYRQYLLFAHWTNWSFLGLLSLCSENVNYSEVEKFKMLRSLPGLLQVLTTTRQYSSCHVVYRMQWTSGMAANEPSRGEPRTTRGHVDQEVTWCRIFPISDFCQASIPWRALSECLVPDYLAQHLQHDCMSHTTEDHFHTSA